MNETLAKAVPDNKTVGMYGGKFFPFHRGHLNFILKAQSQVDILYVVVAYDDEHDKGLCEKANYEWVSSRVRVRWITKELKDFPNIRVISNYERKTDDYLNDDSIFETNKVLLKAVGGRLDYVFSNEDDGYDPYFKKFLPNTQHIMFDTNRTEINISATQIRENNIYAKWDFLPQAVQEYYVKRVAICGTESVGKTHLSKMLAHSFQTETVAEFGRSYYEDIGGYYGIDEPEDYNDIVAGHTHLLNEAAKKANKVLIVDTDLIYTQSFHEKSYELKNQFIETAIQLGVEKIDEYIYIEPYNVYELDGFRIPKTDETKTKDNLQLKELYASYGVTLHIVDEPDRDARYQKCVEIIKNILK